MSRDLVIGVLVVMSFLGVATQSFAQPQAVNEGWEDDGAVVRLKTATDWVGIGTEQPQAKLDVAEGSLRVGEPVSGTGSLLWSLISDPSAGNDAASAIAADSSGMYIVGTDSIPGNTEWRIEKRSLIDGALIWVQTSDQSSLNDGANAIAVDSSGIYVAGADHSTGYDAEWRIQKRALSDGSVIWSKRSDPSSGDDVATAIAADSSGVYVAGFEGGNWRIEKRALLDGSLLWTKNSYPSGGGAAYAITVDSSGVYIAGDYNPRGTGPEWRIEKRALTDGSLIWEQGISTPGWGTIYATAVDSSGVYVAGRDGALWKVEKRTLADGALIWSQTGFPDPYGDIAYAIDVDSTGVYVAGYEGIPGSSPGWRIEKRSLADGSLLWEQVVVPSSNGEIATGIVATAHDIYVVGYHNAGGPQEWRIEKRMNLDLKGLAVIQNGHVGIGTRNPQAMLHVAGGDAAITSQGTGLIMKATDGPNCFRVTVDNIGSMGVTQTSCPQ